MYQHYECKVITINCYSAYKITKQYTTTGVIEKKRAVTICRWYRPTVIKWGGFCKNVKHNKDIFGII